MEPITLIVLALAAGAASGVQGVASSAVADAYASLKALVKRRLVGRPDGELALARYEAAPHTWEAPLAAELTAAKADMDDDLIAAAQTLMSIADRAGFQSGKYNVDVRGSQGVQIGDHNFQQNRFGAKQGPGDRTPD
jgi:hypothetical protein